MRSASALSPSSHQDALAAVRRDLLFAAGWAGFLTLFVGALQLTSPLFMMQVYDRVLSSRSVETLVALVMVSLGALGLWGSLEFIRARTYLVAGRRLAAQLNLPALQAAVSGALSGRDLHSATILRDLAELRNLAASHAVHVPAEMVLAPIFLAILFVVHPLYAALAAAGALCLLVFGVANDLLGRRDAHEAGRAAAEAYGQLGAAARQAETIAAMGMLVALTERWREAERRMLDALERSQVATKAVASGARTVRVAMQILVLAAGALLVLERQATPGSMVAASMLAARLLGPFEHAVEAWRQWRGARLAFGRIRTLLVEGPMASGVTLPRPEGRLVVDRVSYVPPGTDRLVLRGVSFALEPGEALGIVGPSAAGKSTLARLLIGVLRPSSGAVLLDGHDIAQWSRDDLGPHLGYLPQAIGLLDATVADNISRLRPATAEDVVAAARLTDAHELIGRLPQGYATPVGETGPALSGGQRQRIALARAVFGRPVLVVLDEPNAHLDAEGELTLQRTIGRLKEQGVTVVVIAHRQSAVRQCDKLLVLREGRVEQFGARDKILPEVSQGNVAFVIDGGKAVSGAVLGPGAGQAAS